MVTFDAGRVLIDLDFDFLVGRLREREVAVDPARLVAAVEPSWATYDRAVNAGARHPWHTLMAALLRGAGVEPTRIPEVVEWLWREQPRQNLWRRPITAMVDLARELADCGIPVAVLSNSEGHLRELLEEIGVADPFRAVVDSGVVGFSKPDPRIFAHAVAALGVSEPVAVHIGDSYAADVAGALGAGPAWHAVWFGAHAGPAADPRVAVARHADEARDAVACFFAARAGKVSR